MTAKIIIASPLQLINALEAINYFKIKDISITFFSEGNKTNENQIALIIEKLNIKGELSLLKVPKNMSFFNRIRYLRSLKVEKDISFDYIILGHFKSIYQATYANFLKGEKILVDDGTRSLDDISFLNSRGYHTAKYFLKRIFYLLFSIKPYLIEKQYTFFSYYIPKNQLSNQINLIQNKFLFINSLRAGNITGETNNKIAFVGQSLVDTKLTTLNHYLELIMGVESYFKKQYSGLVQIDYYAHRNESEAVLKHINAIDNWSVVKNELPLELHFLLSSEFPKEVGLFFSSVSETLSILFDTKLKLTSFYIHPKDLLDRKSEIETLYETQRVSTKIQLIENYIDS